MEIKTLGAALALTFVTASLVADVGAQSGNDDNYKEVPVGYDEVTPTPREVGQSCNAYSLCKSGLCCLQSDLGSPITTCQPRSAPGQKCVAEQVESPFYLDSCPCLTGTCTENICSP